jgi:hypothetical protein
MFRFFFVLILSFFHSQEKEMRVLQELTEKKEIIMQAANAMNISPRIIAGVIYAERLRNYHWDDAILDDVLAKSGYNSSVGFAQIKINTAFWIEEQLHNPAGKYYLGKDTQQLNPRSRSREELISRLITDSINIRYCAVYLAMIKNRWSDMGYFFTPSNEAGLLATLFSLGIIKSNGEERLPHANSQMNEFGRTAQQFFDSFAVREVFPH